MMRSPFALLLLALTCLPVSLTKAESPLLKLVPPDANALVIIDAEALKKTPLAIQNGWTKYSFMDSPKQEIAIPSAAQEIIIASRLETSQHLAAVWDLALVSSSSTIPLTKIAEAEQGYIDWIGSSQMVWSPGNAYFVSVDMKTLGVLYPADRQLAAKWLDWTKSQTGSNLSGYLKKATDRVTESQQIVIALDLKDVPQPHRLKAILSKMPMLKENSSKTEKWQDLMLGIQGMTLKLSVNKEITGELTVDFEGNPSILAPYEKELVMTSLDRYGAGISDLDQWAFRTNGTSIVATGKISTDNFRRIMSLMEIPSTQYDDTYTQSDLPTDKPQPAPVKVSSAEIQLKTSKAYFDALTGLMDDLRKEKDVDTHNYMLWYERYAKKIDKLPILNVDNELLDFGQSVANTFRDIALAKRTGGINTNVRRTQASAYISNWDDLNVNERTAIAATEKAPAYQKMYDSWNQIDADVAKLRRTLTNKYGVEF